MDSNYEQFDAFKYNKYWRNQIPKFKAGEKFVDPYFPPNTNSLLALDDKGNYIDPLVGPKKAPSCDTNNIEWKRISEIYKNYLLFQDQIECDDINQGSLGNCYFLASLAALTEFPSLIYQIFRVKDVNPEGYYEVVLFLDGEWQVVFVDDYFPVKKGTNNFAFAKPNGNELWVVLLEKIWAKVNGGYINTITGWPSDPMLALTGFPTERISWKEGDDEEVWKKLELADRDDRMLCATTKNDPSVSNIGLVSLHVYTLISAKEVFMNDKRIRLVKLRNPWGYKEWSGDWSDKSPLWTDDLKLYMDHSGDKDDGTFFMSFEDFKSYFICTHSVHLMYNSNVKSIEISKESLNNPLVYNLHITQDTKLAVSVLFKHWRFNRHLTEASHPTSLILAKYDGNYNLSEINGEFNSDSDVDHVRNLTPGYYVIWLYCNLEHCKIYKPEQIYLRISASDQFKIKQTAFDTDFSLLRKLITEGVKEKFPEYKQKEIFVHCDNQFKTTGIGYRVIINNTNTTYQKWICNDNGVQNMTVLPPFKNKPEFDFMVPTMGSSSYLGMRNQSVGTYWFNIKASYLTYQVSKNGECPVKSEIFDSSRFLDFEVANTNTENNFYDYRSSSSDVCRMILKFKTIDLNEDAIQTLKEEHPDIMSQLLSLDQYPDENENLKWGKANYENGFYVGQFLNNIRNGRGAYYWNNAGSYIGYWDNGNRNKYGKMFDANNFLTYEGEVKNGEKSGKGTLYYKNGDKWEGTFLNGMREGAGVYTWANKCVWQGYCKNGVLHGTGLYTNTNGDTWDVTYENNKITK